MVLEPKYVMFTEGDFTRALGLIKERIKLINFKPSKILAFKRGGLVLGVYLSHALGVPLEVIESSKYDYLADLEYSDDIRSNRMSPYLIVDDIIDTGETIEEFIKSSGVRNYQVITLVGAKKFLEQDRIYFVATKNDDEFVIFPWERFDTLAV